MLSTRADVEAGEQVDAVQQGRMVELRLDKRVTVSIELQHCLRGILLGFPTISKRSGARYVLGRPDKPEELSVYDLSKASSRSYTFSE